MEGEREREERERNVNSTAQDSECASPEILAKSICLAVEYNTRLAEQRRTTPDKCIWTHKLRCI
jgi:Tfp pilus assembly protein PilX